MIKEFEIYHGLVLARIAHKYNEFSITTGENIDNSSYVLDKKMGLYIKFSKKRITPWQFTFTSEHYNSVLFLKNRFGKGYISLVCGFDGLCCISFEEFFTLLTPPEHDTTKSISVSRLRNQKYQVRGTDGSLKYKISDSEIEF